MDTRTTLDRAYAHWLEDGILEIEGGFLLAGVGSLRALLHFVPRGSGTYYGLAAGLLAFMIAFAWGARRIGEALKARVTYPRTGYLAFKPRRYTFRRILGAIALLVLAGVLGALVGMLATQPDQQTAGVVVSTALGLAGALAFACAARRFALKRFWYLAAFSLGIGLANGALGVGVVLGVSFYYLGLGLGLVVGGCVALAQYLRRNEPVDMDGSRP